MIYLFQRASVGSLYQRARIYCMYAVLKVVVIEYEGRRSSSSACEALKEPR